MRLAPVAIICAAALLAVSGPASAAAGCNGLGGLFACASDVARGFTEPMSGSGAYHAWLGEVRSCWSHGCSAEKWSAAYDHAKLAALSRAAHAQAAALRLVVSLLV
ncbi:MAG: hypothetical protein ACYDCK_10460 [Thermoplasmatota archaeon]